MNSPSDVDVTCDLESVLGGAVFVSVGSLLSMGINVGARAVFARAYSPAAYGVFSLSFTILLIFSMIATVGLRNGLPRQIAFDEADGKESDEAGSQILWSLTLAGLVGSVVGTLIFHFNWEIATHVFHDEAYALPIALVAVAIPLFTLTRIASAAYRGYSSPHERVVFQELGRNVAFLVLLLGVVVVELDYLAAITMLPASLALSTAAFVAHLYRDNPGRFRDDVVARLRDVRIPVTLVRFSYPLMLTALLHQLMTWMDILMLGYFATSRMVGLYDGVRPLVRVIPIVWRGMIFMYIPLVSAMSARGQLTSIRRVYYVLTKWFASATVPLVLVFVFFPASTLHAVFGPSFVVAAPALQLLAVAFCVGNLIGPTGATLIAMGRTRVLMWFNLVAALVNFGLNVLLIPEIGLLGAAMGTTVAMVLRNLLRLALLYRVGRIHAVRRSLLAPLGLTIGVAAALSTAVQGSVSPLGLVVLSLGLTAFFVASFFLTGSVTEEDNVLVSYVTAQARRVRSFRA
ncbi:flippase [Halomarina halobia]|uniref:Flippase n=1 Tax=Halomarina halobia TaxID=3033386 RepID=A0ABD6ACF4_9EURY|nr:flippase [Halomarina sp. PSR21]